MTRTPDEIKKGLECCANVKVGGICPFDCPLQPLCESGDDGAAQREILAFIQKIEAERDAAVSLIPNVCAYCKWYGTKHGGFFPDCKNPSGCKNISGIVTGWEWRGVQKEEWE